MRFHIKNFDSSNKKYQSISISIQERAYRKYCENLDESRKSVGVDINKSI